MQSMRAVSAVQTCENLGYLHSLWDKNCILGKRETNNEWISPKEPQFLWEIWVEKYFLARIAYRLVSDMYVPTCSHHMVYVIENTRIIIFASCPNFAEHLSLTDRKVAMTNEIILNMIKLRKTPFTAF